MIDGPSTVRHAVADDVEPVTDTLARAFDDDPVMAWLFPDDERRFRRSRKFFLLRMKQFLPQGDVYTTAECTGAAIWAVPGQWHLPALATLHPRFRTPSLAIVVQSTWSCILALTGSYEQLTNYVVFADWIFFGLTVATVLTFRRSLPLARRPPNAFRAPGYPIVQILFVLIAAAVVLSVVGAAPAAAAKGALLIALGIPVYFWYARSRG